MGCEKLKAIELPDTVREIGKEAFVGCVRLNSITIPESVRNIGLRAFDKCENLKRVYLSKNTKYTYTSFPSHTKLVKR